MDLTLEAGTDAAGMVIFDPAGLPDDFDAKQKVEPIAQFEALAAAGRLYWINTQGDGDYTLGVVVGDRLPDRLQPYAKEVDQCFQFHIPSGRLYFTGIEYVFHVDDSALRKYPQMGQTADVSAGVYHAQFIEFDYPDEFHEDLLCQNLPPVQLRLHQLVNLLVPFGCVSLLAILGSLAFLPWHTWEATALPAGSILIALPLILSCLPAYRRANRVYKEIQNRYPGYGVLLQMVEPEG